MKSIHSNSPNFKVTFLGTGTSHGIPVIACKCAVCQSTAAEDTRLRTSIMISSANTQVVIDCGPDFRTQMLREKVENIDALLITHEHRDHLAGLDDIRVFNYQKNGPLTIYCTQWVAENIKEGWSYIFKPPSYPGLPSIQFNYFEESAFTIGDLVFLPIKVWHYKLVVHGFRIGNFAYITDVNQIPIDCFAKLQNLETLVIGALRHRPHIAHFSLAEAIEVAKQINAQNTYFIHMSHDMGLHHKEQEKLPENMFFSHDGLVLNF